VPRQSPSTVSQSLFSWSRRSGRARDFRNAIRSAYRYWRYNAPVSRTEAMITARPI